MGLALTDTAQYDVETLNQLSHYYQLTDIQKSVLYFMAERMTSDLNSTDQEIADLAGVSRKTISNCKQNAHFLACMNELTMLNLKSYIPEAAKALKKKVADGNMKAIDFIYKVTKEYIPTQRNENLNANISTRSGQSEKMEDVVEEFVSQLCDKGLSLGRIIEAVTEAHTHLKEEQRIA